MLCCHYTQKKVFTIALRFTARTFIRRKIGRNLFPVQNNTIQIHI